MKQLVTYFISSNLPDNEELQRKARLTVGTLLLIAASNIQYSLISWSIDFPQGVSSQLALLFLSVLTLFLHKTKVPRSILLAFYFTSCTICIAISVFYTGGSSSIVFMFLATTPITALMVWSIKGSRLTLLVVIAVEILIYYLDEDGYIFPNNVSEEYRPIFFISCNLGFVLLLYWIGYIFEKAQENALYNLEKKNNELAQEKAKSDKLLLNGVEKIKTVGDAYVAAAGLPTEIINHAELAVNTAIEIMASLEKYKLKRKAEKKPYFNFRCGIHSGTVVAGIVGVEKFAYDIWGDAVNTAARLEQHSAAGKINISEQTYASIKDCFKIEYRGEIDAKNKGLIKMYFVSNKKTTRSLS